MQTEQVVMPSTAIGAGAWRVRFAWLLFTIIIMLTMFEDDESVFAALKAGARGYVLKDADRGTLVRAIRAVAQGEALLGPSIARRVLEQFSAPAPPTPAAAAPPRLAPELFGELTARELEVLRLIA